MKRNFTITIYNKNGDIDEIYPIYAKEESDYIDAVMQSLINDDIDYFKYEYNETDINNNQKVHVTHIIKKEGERYYEKIQEQRLHDISLS